MSALDKIPCLGGCCLCQRVGEEIVALRIKGKGSVFQDVPVPERLSQALLEWERHPGGL